MKDVPATVRPFLYPASGMKASLVGDEATASCILYPTSLFFHPATLSSYPCSSFPIPAFRLSFLLPWVFQ